MMNQRTLTVIARLSALVLSTTFACAATGGSGGGGGGGGGDNGCFPNCGGPNYTPEPVGPSYGGQYTPPGAGGGTGGSGSYVCYYCKGRGLVWEPRNAAPPVIPGGIEICPRCGGSGNAGT
jgi:hypothetical protein